MTDSKRTLATKLAEVAAEVAHVGKDGSNSAQNYRFTSAGAVLAKVNPALASRSIATTSEVYIVHQERVETRSGGTQDKVTVKVVTTFIDGEDGSILRSEAMGSGMDSGDKAVMKAQTAAQKYLLKLAFNIDFGDDPEADAKTDKAAVAPSKPVARPGAAPAAPPKQQQVSGTAASYTFKFGNNKNKPIGELDDAAIDWYLVKSEAELNDPEKAKFHAYTRKAIDACRAVLQERHDARMAAGADLPDNGAGGLFGDDEMPV